jgi:uncharacterized protein involved in outer membrane biogenesis
MTRWRRLGSIGLAGFGALLAAAAALPFVVPASIYRDEVARRVAHATGRAFTIAGPLQVTMFPQPGLRVDRVALANVPGGHAPALVTAESLRISVRLWPLLAGRIEVSELELDRPRIALEIGRDGRPNWMFMRPAAAPSAAPPAVPPAAPIPTVRIVAGDVTYRDSAFQEHVSGVEAAVRFTHQAIEVAKLRATLNGAALAGDVHLDTHGKVPSLDGALSIDRLDLNRYIARPPKSGFRQMPPPPHQEGWSRAPISLAILQRFDGRLAIDAGAVRVKHLALGRSHIQARLSGGRLNALLAPMALYGGSGIARLDVDANSASFRTTVTLEQIALEEFLSDTLGVARIEGRGTISLDVAARGTTADAVMHGLHGGGALAFHDGRINGVDFGAAARAMGVKADDFTQYDSMTGSFRIADGVLSSGDFALAGPRIRTTGEGMVDLGNRQIDFRIEPRATARIAALKITVGVPFRIQGRWSDVRYAADTDAVVNRLEDTLKNMLRIP